jgi:hypothetical protein
MFLKTLAARCVLITFLCATSLLGQQQPATSAGNAATEFPVVLEQSVTAGRTAVGTKITAKLQVATLSEGAVIPRGAVFSGEVIDSAAKSATDPSRLCIRMDSAQWKNGSAPVKLYITAWYYPMQAEMGQNLQYQPRDPTGKRDWNGAGTYPDPNSPASKPFPGREQGHDPNAVPDTPASITSNHRVLMKNVESNRNPDGAVVISSKRSNIKVDKLTTYVFAADDLLPSK